MDIFIYVTICVCLLVFFAYQSNVSKKNKLKEMNDRIDKSFGTMPDRVYKTGELLKIRKYFDLQKQESYIDDITWNDMGMDDVFKSINHTWSSIGEDCLYNRLRHMNYSDEELNEFDSLVDNMTNNKDASRDIQQGFMALGRTKSVCIYEFISKLASLKEKKNTEHIIRCILLIVSIGLLFVQPIIGITALVIMVSTNVIRYYRVKKDIEDYFTCFAYIMNMIVCSKDIIQKSKDISPKISDELDNIYSDVIGMTKGVFLIAGNNMSGSLADSLMEYIRMLCHVDIMRFNTMMRDVKKHEDKLKRMYVLIGMLESACAVASYRAYLEREYGYYCKPIFTGEGINGDNLYHPLLKKPVANSINECKSVLLTGSNASGKSTFLKTIGINAILAQTIYTNTGRAFSLKRCKVYSSMSLKDDIIGGESYYMVEIKALKRIVDAARRDERIICFVDEVLRGTNTVERVSASTEILRYLASNFGQKIMCFAATHDIELTYLLEEIYSNYHFEEQVIDEDVLFNYELNKGRATSRNAIQLLKVMGYDDDIILRARERADRFIKTGQY